MIKCIRCDKELEEFGWSTHKGYHPDGGLEFVTYGHYGSTFFDPMDGSTIRVVLCDDCTSYAIEAEKAKYVK